MLLGKQFCMKYQSLFSGKNKKKYFKMSSAENCTQSAISIKQLVDELLKLF